MAFQQIVANFVITGISDEKKQQKKSIIPREEIYLAVLMFDQNLQSYATPMSSHPEPPMLFVCDKAVRQLQQTKNIKNLPTTSVSLDIL